MLLENNPYPQDGRVRREATALTEAGYSVSVICPAAIGQPLRDSVNGVEVFRYAPPRGGDGLIGYSWEYGYALFWSFWLSLTVAKRSGFDVIHSHNPPDLFFLIAVLYKPFGKRFVFDHHDLSPEMYHARFQGGGNPLVHRVLLACEKLSFKLADLVVATNESYRRIAIERGGVPENRIAVVRNGPEIARFQNAVRDEELRRRAETILGYVGVIGVQDGVDILVRAVGHLVKSLGHTDVLTIIIGDGDALQHVKQVAADEGIEQHFLFTGRIDDPAVLLKYLATTDICIDPDPFNAYNDRCTMIKMTEYMAVGKPIVAFDLTEHRVTAQDAAVYARPNDENDLALKIAELMADPERRREMGRIGKGRIANGLSWPGQAPKLVEAYASLA